jgi:uncharacterized protein YdaU (DUF1376 family)
MSAPPAFQLYARDWLMSTRTLPPEARGIYMDLLCLSWDQDGISSNPADLLPHLAITKARWNRIWPFIESKWVEAEPGRLRNTRQEKQRAEYEALRQKRIDAGRKGGSVARANGKPS